MKSLCGKDAVLAIFTADLYVSDTPRMLDRSFYGLSGDAPNEFAQNNPPAVSLPQF
jgi:hypothetical protein